MLVFVVSLVKIVATLFAAMDGFWVKLSSLSVPMLFVWTTDASSAVLFSFKSEVFFVFICVYLLMWLVTPWLTISSRNVVKTVGLSFTLGINLFDIICCMLSALSNTDKICNLVFSIVAICFSVWLIYKENRPPVLEKG